MNGIWGGSDEGGNTDSPQRWAKFQQCMCYDFSTSAFCEYDQDLGVGLSALKQCLPYIGYLFSELAPLLYLNIILWNVFLFIVIARYGCHIFGGGRPSQGCFRVKKRQLFRGYTRCQVWAVKGIFFLFCGWTAANAAMAIIANRKVGDAIDRTVWVAKGDLNQITTAVTLGTTLFGELTKYGFTASALTEANSLLTTVGSYTGSVTDALRYINLANGGGHHGGAGIGRTQIVEGCLIVTIGIIGLAFLLSLVNFSVRGFIHNFLALILSFVTFAVAFVEIAHMILFNVTGDIYQFLVGVKDRAAKAATNACGSATHSTIAQLRQLAVNQFTSHVLCGADNPLGQCCNEYFYCKGNNGKNDLCELRTLGQDVHLKQMAVAWTASYLGNATYNPSFGIWNMASCAVLGCNNETVPAKLAQDVFANYAAVSIIVDKVDKEVAPFVNCEIGFASWKLLLDQINDISHTSEDLLQWTASFLFTIWIVTFLLIPFSKRFTVRNHKDQLRKRRKKRMEKNRALVEKAVIAWVGVDKADATKVANMSIVAPMFNGEMDDDQMSAMTMHTPGVNDSTSRLDDATDDEDMNDIISSSDEDENGVKSEWKILKHAVRQKQLRQDALENSRMGSTAGDADTPTHVAAGSVLVSARNGRSADADLNVQSPATDADSHSQPLLGVTTGNVNGERSELPEDGKQD